MGGDVAEDALYLNIKIASTQSLACKLLRRIAMPKLTLYLIIAYHDITSARLESGQVEHRVHRPSLFSCFRHRLFTAQAGYGPLAES